jgi:hypothetical protein
VGHLGWSIEIGIISRLSFAKGVQKVHRFAKGMGLSDLVNSGSMI